MFPVPEIFLTLMNDIAGAPSPFCNDPAGGMNEDRRLPCRRRAAITRGNATTRIGK